MKKVLIASFYFPPYADIAGMRAFKFCKYLPEFGWIPWVLTIDKRYYGEKVTDYHPDGFDAMKAFRFPYLHIPAAKIFASLIYPLLIILIVSRHRKEIDVVYMIGSPFHPFVLSPIIEKIFHIPVALDFRDAWSSNYGYDGRSAGDVGLIEKLLNKLFFSVEKIALKYATIATFATPTLKDEYLRILPTEAAKYNVIYNGYDESDFKDISPVFISKNITIILTGKFYLYTPEAVKLFLEVIKEIENLTFIYVGNEYKIIDSIAEELGLKEGKVIAMGYKPYDYVLQLIAGSNYCLLTNGVVNGMGTKIFDYLALGKPTLCLVPRGSIIAQRFSNKSGVMINQAPHTKEKIRRKLLKMIENNNEPNTFDTDEFSRRKGTEKLAGFFRDALNHKEV